MFRRILLPLDPTKRLQAAKSYAVAMAQKLGIPITALYVANSHKTGTAAASTAYERGERGECFSPLGKREVERFAHDAEGVSVDTVMRCGVRTRMVARVVRESGVDVMVLGPFRSRWTRFFSGSEVERLLEDVRCHAFVVRHEMPLPGPGAIALVVFNGPMLPPAALDRLEGFVEAFGCDLKLLHLGTDMMGGAEALDAAVVSLRERVAGDMNISSSIEPLRGRLPRRLRTTKRVVEATHARLVILPAMGETVSELLLHELVLSAHIPVCVLR